MYGFKKIEKNKGQLMQEVNDYNKIEKVSLDMFDENQRTDELMEAIEVDTKKISESAKDFARNTLQDLNDLELRYQRKQLKRAYYRKQKKHLMKQFMDNMKGFHNKLKIDISDKEVQFLMD